MSPTRDAARDLLFGLLALQTGLINQAQLVAAFHAWTQDRDRTMAEILAGQGALEAPCVTLVEGLVIEHLRRHGSDPERSLAALGVGPSTRERLARIGDAELDASLSHVGSGPVEPDSDPDRTASYSVGTATSDGQRFRVLRPHARGGLGAIFVALDNELRREVALKQILDAHADDPFSRQRFLVEAEITGGLEHPGIVPVYGLGTYGDGRPYYAMRFVRGDSLKEAIGRFHADAALRTDPGKRSLELRKLLRRFTDVCNAIDYAHSRGVLHRDLKPGNVIVGKHGETLVVDWGLAKATGKADPGSGERTLKPSSASGSAETLPGSALGTPAYMSPEQAEGDLQRLGPRSDVYSLGATLYCLLTGRTPFDGDVFEVLRKVQRGEFAPPRQLEPSLDKALEAVCLKAMAPRPEDRYSSCRALAEDVERWMADEPVAAWREPWTRTLLRWLTRHRTGVTGAAAAVLVGVVGLSVVLAVQTKAKAELAAANTELTHSRAAVLARYDLAVAAIKTLHTGVSGDFLLKEVQFKALRDRLLNSASEFYEKLGAMLKDDTDRSSRRALLQANYEVADLASEVGRKEDALALHRQVLAGRETLAATPGAEPAMAVEVARSLLAVGMALEEMGQADEALAAYEQARSAVAAMDDLPAEGAAARLAFAESEHRAGWLLDRIGRTAEALLRLERARDLQQALVQMDPGANESRAALALSLRALGTVQRRAGRSDEGLASWEAARAIQQRLADANPTVTRFQSELVHILHNLAAAQVGMGKPDEALASWEAARAIQQRLADVNPAVTQFQDTLCRIDTAIGLTLERTGKPALALGYYAREEAIRRALSEAHPSVPEFHSELANCLTNSAATLLRLRRPAEARVRCAEAVGLGEVLVRDDPRVSLYRLRLAESLIRSGQARRAVGDGTGGAADWRRAAALMEAVPNKNAEYTFIYAECRALLSSPPGPARPGASADERGAEAIRAMGLLKEAVGRGFRDPATYRNAPALDPLRGRDDFRLLMMDLEMPADPFARGR